MSNPNSAVMQAIEQLNYRVTVGDVATKSGLELKVVQPELIKLAADTNGNLQVAETGDIAYVFPENFRGILQNKYWRLRWQKFLDKAWQTIFYLIRISFGIFLVISIIIFIIFITVIVVAINSSSNDDRDRGYSNGGGGFLMPRFWFPTDIFWFFSPNYYNQRTYRQPKQKKESGLNFLESIYSFLFGDGHPNPNLEERRWQAIASVIKNNKGAVIAEQVAPYLDNIDMYNERDEDYVLPVLIRFNGYPEVSEQGEIVYYFPELQVSAEATGETRVSSYLKENLWQFSGASSNQKIWAICLGGVNIVLALIVGSFLSNPEVVQQISISGNEIARIIFLIVNSSYDILMAYAVGYLAIPLIRYFWLQRRNNKVVSRNVNREARANLLAESPELEAKIDYAKQFAQQKVISAENVVYSTEKEMLEQTDDIVQDWERRLNSQ